MLRCEFVLNVRCKMLCVVKSVYKFKKKYECIEKDEQCCVLSTTWCLYACMRTVLGTEYIQYVTYICHTDVTSPSPTSQNYGAAHFCLILTTDTDT